MSEYRHGSHTVFSIHLHIVWITQYRHQVTESGIKFAADEPTKTGVYITLSCYYHGTAEGTAAPLLDVLRAFTVKGVGCFNDVHLVASHPALAGTTDASLSNWSCSVHEAFDTFPPTFLPLAIA
jgi:hypothetical protein